MNSDHAIHSRIICEGGVMSFIIVMGINDAASVHLPNAANAAMCSLIPFIFRIASAWIACTRLRVAQAFQRSFACYKSKHQHVDLCAPCSATRSVVNQYIEDYVNIIR